MKRLINAWLVAALLGAVSPIALPADARAGTTTTTTTVPVSPPTVAPADVTAASSDGRVVLAWGAVPGSGYRLFRAADGVWEASWFATTTSLTYTNFGLLNGTKYSFKVAAYNRGGVGPFSGEVSVMPLAAPVVMNPVAGDERVELAWQASAGALTYNVYRSTSTTESSFVAVASDLTGLNFLDSAVTNGTTYYYRVRAFATTLGTSPFSARVSARPLPPPPAGAPANFVVTSGNARADLKWDPVDGVTSYRIFRTTTGVFDTTPYTSTSATTFTNWSLVNGATYSYKVAAYNIGGTGPHSGVVTLMPMATPSGVTAKAGDTQVKLDWPATAGAVSYTLYRSQSSDDANPPPIVSGLAALTYLDTGLTNGVTYYYRLRAYGPNGADGLPIGTSGLSYRVSARPVPPPPAAAPDVVAKAGNARVDVSWNVVADATAYRIFRSTTSGVFDGPAIAKVTTTTYRNYQLTNGTTYYYKVAGNNMGGDGPLSVEVNATPILPPVAPLDVKADPGDKMITLSWAPSDTATSYNIYRGTGRDREATAPIVSVAGPPFVYVDQVDNGPTYFYKLTATNNGGESPRSAEVSATAEGPQKTVDADTTAAFRLLRQATWGPRPGDLDSAKTVGIKEFTAAFLDQQLAAPPSVFPDILFNLPIETAQEHFMSLALTGPDQLRQRVAWALHKIMVASAVEVPSASGIVTYYRLFMNGAFGNFRDLMRAVTLNPAMGRYLNMLNNRSQQVTGVPPNENYPRELMQLFTMGIPLLNPDGTPMLDAGVPVPAYSEADVKALARILTGWTFGDGNPGTTPRRAASENYRVPMEAVPAYHDAGAKTFLGVNFVAGQSAVQDLDQALDVIFKHPNVAPFISRQLIQELVTSNPPPDYVAAVAAVFTGTHGDLAAVVRAILTHPEARLSETSGKLAEPVLFVIAPLRALAANVADHPFMSDKAESMGQKVFYPPSVFSYFSPGYKVRGTGSPPLGGPEFQILTSVTSLERANFIGELLGGWYGSSVTIDYTPFTSKAGDAAALVDYCNEVFMGGRMTTDQRRVIVDAVRASSLTNSTERMRTALYLTLVMAQSQVDR